MALTDLAIGEDGDFVLDGEGNLTFVTGVAAVVQYIKIALMTQLGTYRFDPSFGSQLNELIGQTRLTGTQKTTLVRLYAMNCLNAIPFIKSIEEVTAEYSKALPNTISLNIFCTIYTDEELTQITTTALGMTVAM
jgi:hypothetical protein